MGDSLLWQKVVIGLAVSQAVLALLVMAIKISLFNQLRAPWYTVTYTISSVSFLVLLSIYLAVEYFIPDRGAIHYGLMVLTGIAGTISGAVMTQSVIDQFHDLRNRRRVASRVLWSIGNYREQRSPVQTEEQGSTGGDEASSVEVQSR